MAYMTPHMAAASNKLWEVTSAVGAGLCFPVLLVVAIVATNARSRVYLDRVSFRLVTCSLICSMVFEIANTVGGMMTKPGFFCGFSVFVLQFTLQMSSFLLFFIGLNLQLVVVHGFNGQRLEKFYLIGSVLMAIIITVPPYAAGQYGWDFIEGDCWYTNTHKKERIAWQVTTQLMWTALLALGEVIAACNVVFFLLRHHLRMGRVFRSTRSFSTQANSYAVRSGTESSGGTYQGKPITPQVAHANKYKSIIIRIALYPFASCIFSFLSILPAIHSDLTSGINNATDYNLLLMSDVIYGIRAIFYAALVAVDPALIRAVKTYCEHVLPGVIFWKSSSKRETFFKDSTQSQLESKNQHLVVHIELATIRDRGPRHADVRGDNACAPAASKDTSDATQSALNLGIGKPHFDTAGGPPPPPVGTRDGSIFPLEPTRRLEEGLVPQSYYQESVVTEEDHDFRKQI